MRLKNKSALVTGAARGIGLAIATRFAEAGAFVILTDIDDASGQAAASSLGEQTCYRHLDVAVEADWKTVLAEFDSLDILVNNAGITGFAECDGPFNPEQLNLASWHRVHAVNLDGVALGCKHALPLLKQSRHASIVNISSRSGLVGIPGAAAYASSKAAVRNHSKSVALYCAEQGYPVRCNSIHPGAILTPMWDEMLGEGPARDEAIRAVAADIPLGRMGSADDVAYAAIYLASEESAYVTGIELNIDGGILAGSMARPD